jgi:hypothetical protein
MITVLLALAMSPAFAAEAPPAAAPMGALSVAMLKERFLQVTEEADKTKTLEQLGKTQPYSAEDVSALFDLFSRFGDTRLRSKVMDSLALLTPDHPQLEPLIITYLTQPEPESQLFGVNGAFRLRSRQALPLVRAIAEKKLEAPDPSSIGMLSQRNAWWTQYEALSVLAQWESERTLPILRKKVEQSPLMARLLGRFYWEKIFPDLAAWARSSNMSARARALEAAASPIEPAAAKATREGMLALVRDPKVDQELRHRLALKAGAASTEAEVDALIAEHDKTADAGQRLLWAAAVFAAHSPNSAPLLARYALHAPDVEMREGARTELIEIVGEGPAKALLEPK